MPVGVAFYSHDTPELGHIRRNLFIAQSLAQSPIGATTLMISGLTLAARLPLAPGVDCVTLPAIQKTDDGEYRSRCWTVALRQLIEIRARIIRGPLSVFHPDFLIVDTEPLAAFRELERSLRTLHVRCTRLVLGTLCVITDVTGIPEVVTPEQTGLVVAQYDASGLATAIARLDDDEGLRVRLATAARRRIEQDFDSIKTTAELREMFVESSRPVAAAA
jgi:predicted glycosyltransferase